MKKKLLITAYDFPPQLGGVATYSHELARAFFKQPNTDILVLAPKAAGDVIFDSEQSYPVKRVYLPRKALLAAPIMSYHISRLIRSWKPDGILNPLWFPDGAATMLSLKATLNNIPQYISAHGLEVMDDNRSSTGKIRSRLLGGLKLKTLSAAKNIFPVSNYTAQKIGQLLPESHHIKIKVQPNGVNTDTFRPTQKNPVIINKYNLNGKKVFLSVGRLLPHKGLDQVLPALAGLKFTNDNFAYFILGSGPDRSRLEGLVESYDLKEHVHFFGSRHISDLIDLYNIADLFILPSREELPHVEGFGLVFLEAAACGTPSIGGNSGGVPNAIDDQVTGWLVDPKDISGLQSLISELLESPERLKKASQACLDSLPNKTWDAAAKRMREVLFES